MRRLCIVVGVLVAGGVARAEDSRIIAARAEYDDLHQRRVLELLAPVLAGPLTVHDRAAALRLAGCAHLVLREHDAAEQMFERSFALEPDAALEPQLASSPDARSLFERARGDWRSALA